MTNPRALQPYSDQDIDDYSAYIAKLAAVASAGDPPVTPFRTWFYWRHGAFPQGTSAQPPGGEQSPAALAAA